MPQNSRQDREPGTISDSTKLTRPFVALEGGDGSGKTSIRKYLYRRLSLVDTTPLSVISHGWLVPAHTQTITQARFLGVDLPRSSVLQAYVADKVTLSSRIIIPHLEDRVVLTDRFIASDIVYHSILWNADLEETYEAYARSPVRFPDIVIFVDTIPEVREARVSLRPSRSRRRWDDPVLQRRIYELLEQVLTSGAFPKLSPVIRLDNSESFEQTAKSIEKNIVPYILNGESAARERPKL